MLRPRSEGCCIDHWRGSGWDFVPVHGIHDGEPDDDDGDHEQRAHNHVDGHGFARHIVPLCQREGGQRDGDDGDDNGDTSLSGIQVLQRHDHQHHWRNQHKLGDQVRYRALPRHTPWSFRHAPPLLLSLAPCSPLASAPSAPPASITATATEGMTAACKQCVRQHRLAEPLCREQTDDEHANGSGAAGEPLQPLADSVRELRVRR
mmetsp:Transcript_29915/g.97880  ORF Transcript_29915/g.97880 Transcript_29915/m.97880 type:complete len:205 (-) Transcript_29915:386-1000(-)